MSLLLKNEDRDRLAFSVISLVSAVALAFLFWLIYFAENSASLQIENRFGLLKYLNGVLNFVAAVFLCVGFYFVKNGQIRAHKRMMVSAFSASAAFLVSYIVYHFFHGDTSFAAEGPIRYVYFFVLITHVVLSSAVLPFILVTFYFAFFKKIEKHRKIAPYVFPVWLYVSVTGVIIVLMLEIFNP